MTLNSCALVPSGCKSKDRTKESSKRITIATYRIVTPVPDELRNDLPTPEQVARLLSD